MTPWEIIDEALARQRPVRTPVWLAERIEVSIAAMGNWRKRGIPAARIRPIAKALGLTVDQLEGHEPLPWDKALTWPFPDQSLLPMVERLEHDERVEIQAKIRELVDAFEQRRLASLGKLPQSKGRANGH